MNHPNYKKSEQNIYHRAKKSLGQNFLKSNSILNKIILIGETKPEDTILEIGPGKGALTQKLLENAHKVIAVEKDEQLYAFLREKFANECKRGQLILINADILNLDISKNPYFITPYKIIANIPYNITGAIFKKFLTTQNRPKNMTLLVQHEVAKRIMARDHKESLLSISIKAYGTPSMPLKVPARYFAPMPKVDSAVIHIKEISGDFFNKKTEKEIKEDKFWEIVRAGFAHKRKKLSGNLKNLTNITSKEDIKTKLIELKLQNSRAEDLSLEDWGMLAKE